MKRKFAVICLCFLTGLCLTSCGLTAGREGRGSDKSEKKEDKLVEKEKLTAENDGKAEKEKTEVKEKKAASVSKGKTEAAAKLLESQVKGIKDFSTLEGVEVDPMTGVSWDSEKIKVSCDISSVDFYLAGDYELTYTITDKKGLSAKKTIKVHVQPDMAMYLYGLEGDVWIEPKGSFDPMEGIVYDPPLRKVEADTSALNTSRDGDYLINYKLEDEEGHKQTMSRLVHVGHKPKEPVTGFSNGQQVETAEGYASVTDLGVWRLTAYMDTPEDQGAYVGQTASGAPLVAGRTVAVSAATCARLGLNFGDKLMIDGHVYTLEDHGGSAMNDQDWVDIFVDNPQDEYSEQFNKYTHVYLLR